MRLVYAVSVLFCAIIFGAVSIFAIFSAVEFRHIVVGLVCLVSAVGAAFGSKQLVDDHVDAVFDQWGKGNE